MAANARQQLGQLGSHAMTKNLRKMLGLLSLAGCLTLAGCNQNSGATPKAELGTKKADAQTLTKEDVATTVAVQVNLPETVTLTGSLAADEMSAVAAKRGGLVDEVLVDRGSVVKKGDPLVKLSTIDAVNSLQQSEAAAAELMVRLGLGSANEKFDAQKQPDVKAARMAMELAQSNMERDKKLFSSKVISPEEFEKTQNAYTTARQKYDLALAQAAQMYQSFQTALTRVKSARQFVEDMTVKAPYDGAVVEKLVSRGEALMDGARVISLVRMDPLRLVLNVPEQAVGKIAPGQEVQFTVDAFPGQQFQGKVKNIAPALDPDTRTLAVEALVDNPEHLLRPGLFAAAQLQLDKNRAGVHVPQTAVRRVQDVAQVFVVDDGIARARMVVPGETRRGVVEIMAGLQGGERIVSNASEVQDGIRIQ